MVLFRADGNSIIGMGHVMRCLSIAEAFKRSGETCLFALADDGMSAVITSRGFDFVSFESDYRNPMNEIGLIKELVRFRKPRLLVVDSYYVTDVYLRELMEFVTTVVIDDLLSTAYPVDVLINYNVYADSEAYKKLYAECGVQLPRLLLGTEVVPLREEFSNLPITVTHRECAKVLLSTGGADSLHLAIGMAKYIVNNCGGDGIEYILLIGPLNTDKDEIESIISGNENISTRYNVKDMPSLIQSCDIVLSAAGSTLYEICACGVPLVTYVIADNQGAGAKMFEEAGLAINCGVINCENVEKCFSAINELKSNQSLRRSMKRKMRELIDGNGANRIVAFLNHIV